jgi:hypothetical protein
MPQQVIGSVGLLSEPSKIRSKNPKKMLNQKPEAKDAATPKRQFGTTRPFLSKSDGTGEEFRPCKP